MAFYRLYQYYALRYTLYSLIHCAPYTLYSLYAVLTTHCTHHALSTPGRLLTALTTHSLPPVAFFRLYQILFCTTIVTTGVGVFVSLCVDVKNAQVTAMILCLISVLFNGASVTMAADDPTPFGYIMMRLSFARYTYSCTTYSCTTYSYTAYSSTAYSSTAYSCTTCSYTTGSPWVGCLLRV
jgi:hypothetical protein